MAEGGERKLEDSGDPPTDADGEFESWLREAAREPAEDVGPLLPRPGDLLADKFRVDELIGRGGMGVVYACTNQATQRRVALKWMLPRTGSASALARFVREAHATGRIRHPNVVDVYDVGQHEGVPFLVMELLQGETLRRRIDKGPLEPSAAVRIALHAMRGVAAAHAHGVVHRDLKPDNIFLCRGEQDGEPEPKVLDFGIAKVYEAEHDTDTTVTSDGTMLGTPAYMSPEQARGARDIDARVDIYALGAILYHCLSGRLPFEATSHNALIVKIATEPPTPLAALRRDLPAGLDAVVERAMARDRDERYPDVETFAKALEPFARGRSPVEGTKGNTAIRRPRQRTGSAHRGRPRARTLLLGAGLLVALAAGWLAVDKTVGDVRAHDRRKSGDDDGTSPPPASTTASAVMGGESSGRVALPHKPDEEHLAVCSTCAATGCGPQRQACEREPHCAAFLACISHCSDPACSALCEAEHPLVDAWRSPTRDAVQLYQQYEGCVYDEACPAECNRGRNLGCAGHYEWELRKAPLDVEVVLLFHHGSRSVAGSAGVGVKRCSMFSPSCEGEPTTYTDARGIAHLTLPRGITAEARSEFLEFVGPDRHTLWFFPPLSRSTRLEPYRAVGTTGQTFEWVGRALSMKLAREETGMIMVGAVDCAGMLVPDLRLSLAPETPGAVPFYYKDGMWSRVTQLTQSAPVAARMGAALSGGFVAVPPGRYIVRAEHVDGGERHGEREIAVRAGSEVIVALPPRTR